MARSKRVYEVMRQSNGGGGEWYLLSFAKGSKDYCQGFVDAMDSLYPSRPYRIAYFECERWHIVRETKGRGAAHV